MNMWIPVCAFILLGAIIFTLLAYASESLDGKIRKIRTKVESALPEAPEDIEKIWRRDSWAGNDPFNVVVLAHIMAEKHRESFDRPLHLATSYYSQVKFLAKKGRIPTAIAFLLRARNYSLHALLERSGDLPEGLYRKAIELEQIGATEFMLSKTPLLGILFRERAILFLVAADNEISHTTKNVAQAKEAGHELPQPNTRIEKGIIWGKLYNLTKNEEYRKRVLATHFKEEDRETNLGQYNRIAKLIGLDGAHELFGNVPSQAPAPASEEQRSIEQEPTGPKFSRRVTPSSPRPPIVPTSASSNNSSLTNKGESSSTNGGSSEPSSTPEDDQKKQ